MKDTIVPEVTTASESSSPGLVDRWASQLAHRQLRGLGAGALTIIDHAGTHRFDAGSDLRATVRVHDPRFYRRLLTGGSLAAADAYIRGGWSCDDLTMLCRIFARNLEVSDDLDSGWARVGTVAATAMHWLRRNSKRGSRDNIHAHYDLGNEFFGLFLDETMSYSCGIFERPTSSMHEASIAKLERICRTLDLRRSDHLLEIGTGWGGLALHAAERYGCRVTTTTISREQHDLAVERIRRAGLSDRVTVLLRDYRDLTGRYDKLVSVEMIEAVGHDYLDTYFGQCSRLLAPDGLMLLQAITTADHRYESYRRSVDFIQRYVFPGSCIPSVAAMCQSIARATNLRPIGLDDLTPHYAETLRRWRARFFERLDDVRRQGFSDEFIRLWEFYLCYCEAGFEERTVGDVHLLLAKPGARPGRTGSTDREAIPR